MIDTVKNNTPFHINQIYRCDKITVAQFERNGFLQFDDNYIKQSKLNIRYLEWFYPEYTI